MTIQRTAFLVQEGGRMECIHNYICMKNHDLFHISCQFGYEFAIVLGSQKRTSKSKKNLRKNTWKQKVTKQATRAIFLAKYILKNKPDLESSSEESSSTKDSDLSSNS